MPREGFKLDPEHSPECYLAPDRQEFIVYLGWENRDKLGRKYADRRGHWWHKFQCNCSACSAVLLVRWDVLMIFLQEGLGSDSKS